MKYVAYFRTSTDGQDLGIEAQAQTCERYFSTTPDAELIATFSEQISGRKSDRPELAKALDLCVKEDAVLWVAKIDRLTRNVSFGMQLRDRGIKIRAYDCPEFGDYATLMLTVVLGLAQQEAELISRRTKAALAVLKAEGVQLGKVENLTDEGRAKGREANAKKARESKENKQAFKFAKALAKSGATNAEICRQLNEADFTTPRGCKWTRAGVARLLAMFAE